MIGLKLIQQKKCFSIYGLSILLLAKTHPMFLLFIDIQGKVDIFVMVSAGPNVVFCTEMLPSAVSLIVFKAVHSVNTSSPRAVA